jgi:hypothetical protein
MHLQSSPVHTPSSIFFHYEIRDKAVEAERLAIFWFIWLIGRNPVKAEYAGSFETVPSTTLGLINWVVAWECRDIGFVAEILLQAGVGVWVEPGCASGRVELYHFANFMGLFLISSRGHGGACVAGVPKSPLSSTGEVKSKY